METMSVRIDPELRRRLARVPDLNWSEVVRDALRERLELEEELRRPIHRARALRGARGIDRFRRKYGQSGFDSTKEIRKWRDSRK